MLLSSCQLVINNIKNKYDLTNIDISIKTGVSKATIDKITSGQTKNVQDKTLEKLRKVFKEFNEIAQPLNKIYVDETTKKVVEAIERKPELKKVCAMTCALKSSDLKAISRILEKMSDTK